MAEAAARFSAAPASESPRLLRPVSVSVVPLAVAPACEGNERLRTRDSGKNQKGGCKGGGKEN